MTVLTQDQIVVLEAAMQKVKQLKEALEVAEAHSQALIIGITGERGSYRLANKDGSWLLEKADESDTLAELNSLIGSEGAMPSDEVA